MKDLPDTDFTIQGHTDNTGTYEVNERVSLERAKAVSSYLQSCGIATSRLTEVGLAYDYPVADNSTAEGRRQNSRVEVYITANEEMIKNAEAEAVLFQSINFYKRCFQKSPFLSINSPVRTEFLIG